MVIVMLVIIINFIINLQIIAEDFLDNKMSAKDFVQAYKQERVVSWRTLTAHRSDDPYQKYSITNYYYYYYACLSLNCPPHTKLKN